MCFDCGDLECTAVSIKASSKGVHFPLGVCSYSFYFEHFYQRTF